MDSLHVPEGLTEVQPIREIIFEFLREAILEGRIHPGQRLIERDVAERFKASRTPVREALRKLEMEGFIERKGRRGDVVRSIKRSEMEEAYALRMALEPLMVRCAMERLDTTQKDKLKQLIAEVENFDESDEGSHVSENLMQFDQLLLDACGMPKLKAILINLQENLRRFRRLNLSHRGRRMEAVLEHKEIYQAVLANDTEKAEQLTKKHVENSLEELTRELKKAKVI